MQLFTVKTAFFLGLVSRLVLLGVCHFMDNHTHIKFTDIDYRVLTDGAKHVLEGGSPFERHTFRYTPLLAYMMLPNLIWGVNFGKLIFVACEFLGGYLLLQLTPKYSEFYRALGLIIWFFNPLTMVLAVRGSSDVVVSVMIFGLFLLLKRRRWTAAALLYGLIVHFRIYPLVFCIVFYLYVARKHKAPFINWPSIRFGLIAAATLGLLTGLFYLVYGFEFLHEAYLYHLTRKDHRHNFSLMFYLIYLTFQQIDPVTSGLLLLVPAFLILMTSFRYFYRPILACFLTSLIFVTYNKVVTAQYYVWFFQFLPLLVQDLFGALTVTQRNATLGLYGVWLFANLVWNHFAYRFETLGHDVFLSFHVVNCVLFMVGVLVVFASIKGAQLSRPSELRS
jgi:phosphatidylinositol glycan class M